MKERDEREERETERKRERREKGRELVIMKGSVCVHVCV